MTSMQPGDFTFETLRLAYGIFPSGVTAVCALRDNIPVGMAASSFTSVSLQPALVSVCLAHSSSTWPHLRAAPRLGISVLADDHDQVARALSAKNRDRFTEVQWEASDAGAVFLHGCCLWLECDVVNEVRAGDHDIIVMQIQALQPYPDIAPMVFQGSRFRKLSG